MMRRTYVGISLVVVAVVMWALSFAPSPMSGLLPVGGLLCFAAGWLVLGSGLRLRGRPALGALTALGAYLVLGFVWVIAWNTVLRFKDHTVLPEMTQPTNVLVLVLTWPWQAVVWIADPFF